MGQGTNNEETKRRFSTKGFSKPNGPRETKPRVTKTNKKGSIKMKTKSLSDDY